MTGLYEPPYATQARGKFDLRGLPKQLETLGSPDPFNATYTLSINELDSKGFEDQAPPLINTDAPIIDTTHLFNPLDARDVYDDTYPEEVFHESGEVFDLDNVEAGTELYWDPASQAVLSALTGDTLPEMLNGEPMFGDTNEICPVLALTAGLPTQHGPNLLRAFRDGVLVKTAAGKAFVRWYYRVSPSVVTYLRDHAVIYQIGRGAAIATEFALAHIVEMIAMAALGIAGWKLRRRRQLAATALVCLGAFALSLGPAQAMKSYMSEAEVIHVADLIVVWTVTLVESRELGDRHRIVTDITIEIDTTLKGTGNKGSEVFIRQPGGRVNGLRTFASELPMFTQGEEVLLYLEYREGSGYAVVGGARGMYGAKFDEATKEYNIKAPQAEKEIAAKAAESGASKALKESNSTDGYVAVSILKAYIASVLVSAAP